MTLCAKEIVQQEWQRLQDQLVANESVYASVCKEAWRNPKLSKLFPFMGMPGLCFSTVCEYPYFVDVLISHMEGQKFGVYVASGDGGWVEIDLVSEGDAASCVSIAADVLPVDYGGAILGDANEWRKLKGIPLVKTPYD